MEGLFIVLGILILALAGFGLFVLFPGLGERLRNGRDKNSRAEKDREEEVTKPSFNDAPAPNRPGDWRNRRLAGRRNSPLKSYPLGRVLRFYTRGNEMGFKLRELRMLHALASRLGLSDLNLLTGSTKSLDKALSSVTKKTIMEELLADESMRELLFKVFSYRMSVEKNRPRYRSGLNTTRHLKEGQAFKVLVPQVGVFTTTLQNNLRNALRVGIPNGNVPSGFSWRNQSLDIYFSRKGDATYYFQTRVVNEPQFNSPFPELLLKHSDLLQRTQKRNSLRVMVLRDGEILPLDSLDEANEVYQPGQGFLCKVVDVSETGAGIIVRGRVKPGRLLKVQFQIGSTPFVLCGEIKALTRKPQHGVNILHVEALPLSKEMRIRIMAYVLGLLTEEAPKESPMPKPERESGEAEGAEARNEAEESGAYDPLGQEFAEKDAKDPDLLSLSEESLTDDETKKEQKKKS